MAMHSSEQHAMRSGGSIAQALTEALADITRRLEVATKAIHQLNDQFEGPGPALVVDKNPTPIPHSVHGSMEHLRNQVSDLEQAIDRFFK